MDEKDALWGLYRENRDHARHHDAQQTSVTNIILIVAAGTAGLVPFDARLSPSDLPLTLFLAVLGAFGAAFTRKYYHKYRVYMARARHYRDELQRLLSEVDLGRPERRDDLELADVERVGLSAYWTLLNLLVAALGIVLSVLALV